MFFYNKINIDKEFSLIIKFDLKIREFYNGYNFIEYSINVNKNKDNMKFIDLNIENYIRLDNIKKKFKFNNYNKLRIMINNRFDIVKLIKDELKIKLKYVNKDKILSYNKLDVKIVKKVRTYEDIIKDKFSKRYDLRLVMNNSKKFCESEEFLSYKKDLIWS